MTSPYGETINFLTTSLAAAETEMIKLRTALESERTRAETAERRLALLEKCVARMPLEEAERKDGHQ